MKKLLTLDNLYSFFIKQNKDFFLNKDNPITVFVEEEVGLSSAPVQGLLKVHLKSCHIYKNRNGSYISEEAMKEAIPSFTNKPILGYIHELSDGTYDFAGHEMDITDDGEILYKEIPVGIIPESGNPQLVYDENEDKTYLEVDGYIFEDYTRAAKILRNKQTSKVSVELCIDEMSYSAKDKVLNIDKFHFSGITILGKSIDTEEEIEEGMQGATISLVDFSANNNIVKMLEEINDKISNLKIYNSFEKGGIESVKFKELLKKYNKTVKDISFEYEDLTDEELEKAFEDAFAELTEPIEEDIPVETAEEEAVEEVEPEIIPAPKTEESIVITVTVGAVKRNFELSMQNISELLCKLVNETYGEEDNEWYFIDLYDDYVVMHGCCTLVNYKQSYEEVDGEYVLIGEREVVYANYLTKAEVEELEKMRADYEDIQEKLEEVQAKEDELKKEEIINDDAYECIKDSEEFQTLTDTINDLSVEEVESKCNEMLKTFSRKNRTFSSNTKRIRVGAKKEEEYSPYGKLFS